MIEKERKNGTHVTILLIERRKSNATSERKDEKCPVHRARIYFEISTNFSNEHNEDRKSTN